MTSEELTARLRTLVDPLCDWYPFSDGTASFDVAAAADLIESQQTRIAELEAARDDQGVGNCGFIDPLLGLFEDDEKKAPPWWVPLAPAAPITACQAWGAFLNYLCEPRRIWIWSGGKSSYTPEGERFMHNVHEVTNEFAAAAPDTPEARQEKP